MRVAQLAVVLGLQVLFAGFFCDDADAHGDASAAPFAVAHAEHASHGDFACPDAPDEPLWQRAGGNQNLLAASPGVSSVSVVHGWAGADAHGWPLPPMRGAQAVRPAPSLALLSRLLI